jgi:hypothetical protein
MRFLLIYLAASLALSAGSFVAGMYVVEPIDLRSELHALEDRCSQLAAARCMNVTTPVLNVNVYDAPSLGRSKP